VILAVLLIGTRHGTAQPESTSISSAIALGIRFARFTPAFRRLLGLLAIFALTSAVIQSALPSRTQQLGGSADTYGLLLGCMGLGALVGAFGRQTIMDRIGSRATQVTIVAFGLAGITMGMVDSVVVVGLGLAVAGACWVLTLVTLNATSQTISPEWIRGRAMSLYTLAFTGILPLGSILGGAVADAVGAGRSMALLSVGTVLLGLARAAFPHPRTGRGRGTRVQPGPGPRRPPRAAGWRAGDGPQHLDHRRGRLPRFRGGDGAGAPGPSVHRRPPLAPVSQRGQAGEVHRGVRGRVVARAPGPAPTHRRRLPRPPPSCRGLRPYRRPATNHLLGVDVAHPPDWEELVAAHEAMHRTDGSIPLSR
jgi:hypothetical protein